MTTARMLINIAMHGASLKMLKDLDYMLFGNLKKIDFLLIRKKFVVRPTSRPLILLVNATDVGWHYISIVGNIYFDSLGLCQSSYKYLLFDGVRSKFGPRIQLEGRRAKSCGLWSLLFARNLTFDGYELNRLPLDCDMEQKPMLKNEVLLERRFLSLPIARQSKPLSYIEWPYGVRNNKVTLNSVVLNTPTALTVDRFVNKI